MEQYLQIGNPMMASFKRIEVMHFPRIENQMADTLANLATSALHPCNVEISVMDQPSIQGTTVMAIDQQAEPSWMTPIAKYLLHGTLLKKRAEALKVKAQAIRYSLIDRMLYRLPNEEAEKVIEQVH